MAFRGENGISLLGITGYAIVDIDDKYVMVEILEAQPLLEMSRTRGRIFFESASSNLHDMVLANTNRHSLPCLPRLWFTRTQFWIRCT